MVHYRKNLQSPSLVLIPLYKGIKFIREVTMTLEKRTFDIWQKQIFLRSLSVHGVPEVRIRLI